MIVVEHNRYDDDSVEKDVPSVLIRPSRSAISEMGAPNTHEEALAVCSIRVVVEAAFPTSYCCVSGGIISEVHVWGTCVLQGLDCSWAQATRPPSWKRQPTRRGLPVGSLDFDFLVLSCCRRGRLLLLRRSVAAGRPSD